MKNVECSEKLWDFASRSTFKSSEHSIVHDLSCFIIKYGLQCSTPLYFDIISFRNSSESCSRRNPSLERCHWDPFLFFPSTRLCYSHWIIFLCKILCHKIYVFSHQFLYNSFFSIYGYFYAIFLFHGWFNAVHSFNQPRAIWFLILEGTFMRAQCDIWHWKWFSVKSDFKRFSKVGPVPRVFYRTFFEYLLGDKSHKNSTMYFRER